MLAVVRDAVRAVALLWATWARVLKARGAGLLLLFLLGWASYYLTVMVTGLLAPRWAWVVIPLMGLGVLIQLIITLTAYRRSIRAAEIALAAPPMPQISFAAMVSTLLVPFAAAYSAFGFFTQYARDGVQAAAAMVGTLADTSFLNQVDPFASVTTLIVVVAAFVVLWVTARLIKLAANKHKSVPLALLSAFVSACTTFLVLVSISHLYSYASAWLGERAFMGWRDRLLSWLGGLVRLDVPHIFSVAWGWWSGAAWPVVWTVLSQPILWLAVVALVGGMQFVKIDTVWEKLRHRLHIQREHELAVGLTKKAGKSAIGFISGLLPFFHLLTVILRSGIPFLGALIVSFAAIQQAGAWLSFAVQRLIGPVSPNYVFLLSPIPGLITMVVVPLAQAMLLSVAYVRLRQSDDQLTFTRPTGLSWKPLLAVVVSLALAIGISLAKPGDPAPIHPMTSGQPVTLMTSQVTVDDLRVGRALTGTAAGLGSGQTIPSLGVFVAVRVSVGGHDRAGVYISAQTGGVSYTPWDSTLASYGASPGFRVTEDVVFEVPAGSLDDLTIDVVPIESLPMTLPVGVFAVPPGAQVDAVITVDETQVTEVVG